jgi:hypothetical protein
LSELLHEVDMKHGNSCRRDNSSSFSYDAEKYEVYDKQLHQ